VTVTAQNLIYSGPTNQAVFSGGVAVRGADATLTADHVTVFLKESAASTQLKSQNRNAAQQGGPAAAQIDRIIADGNVTIVQPERRATGQKLVYVAANQSFTLTGGPPSIFDAEHGTVTGDSLTFYTRDDRVLIESSGKSRTVTQTRVKP
jgi:lipopolysaccharide export system protein LptA